MNVLKGDWDQDPESHIFTITDADKQASKASDAAWQDPDLLKTLSIDASRLIITAEQASQD